MFRHFLKGVIKKTNQTAALLFALLLCSSVTLLAQSEGKDYMIPDIGAPGLATKIEIISKFIPLSTDPSVNNYYFNTANFYTGDSTILFNNPGDPIRIICMDPLDYAKVTIGPLTINWEGQCLSTHIFVHDDVTPNSADWEQLNSNYKIPIGVQVGINILPIDTFYVLQPYPALNSLNPTISIGSGQVNSGKRSPRGAMIFENFSLSGTGQPYTISTNDCDPYLEGNQGYLPVHIFSVQDITIGANTTLSVDASLKNAGPGGGGGGAGSVNGNSGNGFTAGGYSCTPNGSSFWNESGSSSGKVIPSPQSNYEALRGNFSINGTPGGYGRCDQGGGGGTGHPLGASGAYGATYAQSLSPAAFPGMFGGGSAGGEINVQPDSTSMPFGGGGGGNGSIGQIGEANYTSNAGRINGNKYIVPLSGGSGGGAGNVWSLYQGGSGGGGGGSICLFAYNNTNIGKITANGGDGSDGYVPYASQIGIRGASGGGGGSGGCIVVGAKKQHLGNNYFEVNGGDKGLGDQQDTIISHDGGAGGSGRVRIDGDYTSLNLLSDSATYANGPSTDTSYYVNPQFTLTGTGNGSPVSLYLKHEGGIWYHAGTATSYSGNTWSYPLTLNSAYSTYLLVAAQQELSPSTDTMQWEPEFILSQGATNFLEINLAPILENDSTILFENDSIVVHILDNDFDPNGNDLSINIVGGPNNGTAFILNGDSIQYTPDSLFFGADTIVFEICDGYICDTSYLYISVIEDNDPPLTEADFISTDEDQQTSFNIIANDTDPDPNDTLSITSIIEGPFNGAYTIIGDSIIAYEPNPNFFGNDYLIYEVCNQNLFPCSTDTVYITVNPVNDGPFLTDDLGNPTLTDSIVTPEDTPIDHCLEFNDFENDSVFLESILLGGYGAISFGLNDTCLSYTPLENFNGVDSFLILICDNNGSPVCDTMTIIINVLPVNDAPITGSDYAVTNEDIAISSNVLLNDFDIEADDTLQITSILEGPFNGSYTIISDSIILYEPNENYFGSDYIIYEVCDNQPQPECASDTLFITVNPINDGPFLLDELGNASMVDSATTLEDTPITICFNFNDIENDSVSLESILLGGFGDLIFSTNDTCLSYTPPDNFNGLDSFLILVCDDNINQACDTISLYIDVLPDNDAPDIIDPYTMLPADTLVFEVMENDSINICLNINDIDGDSVYIAALTFLSNNTTGNGNLEIAASDTCFSYIPDFGFEEADTIKVIVSDGNLTDTVYVIIDVIPENNPPYLLEEGIQTDSIYRTTLEDSTLIICLDFFDDNLDTVTISYFTPFTDNASISISEENDSCLVYDPNLNFYGLDSIEVIICDDGIPSLCDTIIIYIDVTDLNDAPIIENDQHIFYDTTYENTEALVCFSIEDVDYDELYLSDDSYASSDFGFIYQAGEGNDTCFYYLPDSYYTGTDTLVIFFCDYGIPSLCDSIIVIMTIIPINDPPLANSVVLETTIDTPLEILLYDYVSDQDDSLATLSYSLVEAPQFGSIDTDYESDVWLYTPNMDYIGYDTLKYEVCDPLDSCDQAYVYITITYDLYFPNGISPNNDGNNDFFEILGLEKYVDAEGLLLANSFQVYNRWGNLVYSISNYNNIDNKWDGKSNISVQALSNGNYLPEGTYYYYFNIDEIGLKRTSFVILKY